MVFHRLILNAIRKSRISGRALILPPRHKRASMVGSAGNAGIHLSIGGLKVRESAGASLEIPETSVLLRGKRNAVGLTAVFSVRAFSWNT